METIYKIISDNPNYFVWGFCIINFLWAGFLYFNKKRHDRELEGLKHSYNLDLEKRKKIYQMKASQFERYFQMVDDFGKRQQVDLPNRLHPIFNAYMENYLKAQATGGQEASTAAITKFGSQISEIMNEGMEQYLSLKSETNSLKLIASDALAILFDDLQNSYDRAFNISQEFMGKFVELIVSNNQSEIQRYQELMFEQAEEIKGYADKLMSQMRLELKEI